MLKKGAKIPQGSDPDTTKGYDRRYRFTCNGIRARPASGLDSAPTQNEKREMAVATTPTDARYVIMGRPESGYSMKVRAAMLYKGIAHDWTDRCLRNDKLFQAHAKVQLIPLVFQPDGTVVQDSTPILEQLEADFPTPAIHPTDPTVRFLSELFEEYGDEWANKLMFHYRWSYAADQKHRSGVIVVRVNVCGSFQRLPAPDADSPFTGETPCHFSWIESEPPGDWAACPMRFGCGWIE